MADETTDSVVAEPTTEQPTSPLVNAEGELREGWRDSLPEDIRADKVFDRVVNFEGVMKSLSSAERAYGKDKIQKPTEADGEDVWDAFYEAGGRPSTAEDYGFKRPDDIPEEHYSEEFSTAVQQLLHKHGASAKLASALKELSDSTTVAALTKQKQDEELAMIDLENGLKTDWGQAYDQKVHLGNVAIEQAVEGNEEFRQRLTQKLGNDPDFIRAMATLGGKFAEASPVNAQMIPTPGDLQVRIDEEMQNPAYGIDFMTKGFTQAQHDAQVQKVYRMRQEMTPEEKP